MDEPSIDEVKIILRDFDQEQDQAMIYSTWRNSLFYSSSEQIYDSPQTFFRKQTHKIKPILKNALIKIACFEDTPSVIVGYCVTSANHVYFIYVKTDFRKKGIATMLFPKTIETATKDLTKIGKILAEKKNLRVIDPKIQGELDDRRTEDRQTNQRIQVNS